MNIQRFHAPTAREALAMARAVFGDAALILANRQLPTGEVEVTATSEEAIGQLGQPQIPHTAPSSAPALEALAPPTRATVPPVVTTAPAPARRVPGPSPALADSTVGADTEQLAMSTLSFQDYVRERMARRQQVEQDELKPLGMPPDAAPRTALAQAHAAVVAAQASLSQVPAPLQPAAQPGLQVPAMAVAAVAAPSAPPESVAAVPSAQFDHVMGELQAMKNLMEERFTTLSWMSQARQEPVRSTLLLKLIRAGFSPVLARTVLERVSSDMSPAEAIREVMATLEHMLQVHAGPGIEDAGGIYAFVGATGVGKTTTIAKLATMCARAHGAQSVGLITLDTYRAGAHEQLRAYGRSINVVAHLAHDRPALLEMLGLFSRKKLVLVDTTGVAPRDPRLGDQLAMLDVAQMQRVLVLNAGTHGDTLDEIAGAFQARQAVISKTDEAVKLGPVLDTLIRHQLQVTGVTCGQRVPEDWRAPDRALLVRDAMRATVRSAFEPRNNADMDFYLSPSQCTAAE